MGAVQVGPHSGIRIAVLPDSGHYRSWDQPRSVKIIASELDAQGYTIVERAGLDQVIGEQDLARSGRFDVSTTARIGRLIGATHLLLVATEVDDKWQDMRVSSTRLRKYTISARIHARLVDVERGQIAWSGQEFGSDSCYSGRNRHYRRESNILSFLGSLTRDISYQENPDEKMMTGAAVREAAKKLASRMNVYSSPQLSEGSEYIDLRLSRPASTGDHFYLYNNRGKRVSEVVIVKFLRDGRARAQLSLKLERFRLNKPSDSHLVWDFKSDGLFFTKFFII